jgi:hypothetical protein
MIFRRFADAITGVLINFATVRWPGTVSTQTVSGASPCTSFAQTAPIRPIQSASF